MIALRNNDDLYDSVFSLGLESRNSIIELYKLLRAAADNIIAGFTLEIDDTGTYRFAYCHYKPKRLNGIWDAEKEAHLDNYLSNYKAKLLASGRRVFAV